MNTLLTTEAVEALKRIRALREATKKTGFQTTAEQSRILLSLNNDDLLAVSEELARVRDEPAASLRL
jgi:DNA polymerase III sliding clamp (beta) subunit (PCNA family)